MDNNTVISQNRGAVINNHTAIFLKCTSFAQKIALSLHLPTENHKQKGRSVIHLCFKL